MSGDEPSVLPSLFGSSLIGKGSSAINVHKLKVDYVMLYFSAHWCPPCKAFTPALAKFYDEHASDKSFEIVFVTCDNNEKEFNSYFKTMPWLAINFDEEQLREKMTSKYDVEGIPYLVVIDAKTGELVTTKGRQQVTDDPDAKSFPWKSD